MSRLIHKELVARADEVRVGDYIVERVLFGNGTIISRVLSVETVGDDTTIKTTYGEFTTSIGNEVVRLGRSFVTVPDRELELLLEVEEAIERRISATNEMNKWKHIAVCAHFDLHLEEDELEMLREAREGK